jgi:hypothetical protein
VKGQLPVLHQKCNVNRHKEARDNERKRQEYNEKYDRRVHRSRKDEIKVGDHVFVRQNRQNQPLTQHHMSLQNDKTRV